MYTTATTMPTANRVDKAWRNKKPTTTKFHAVHNNNNNDGRVNPLSGPVPTCCCHASTGSAAMPINAPQPASAVKGWVYRWRYERTHSTTPVMAAKNPVSSIAAGRARFGASCIHPTERLTAKKKVSDRPVRVCDEGRSCGGTRKKQMPQNCFSNGNTGFTPHRLMS